MTEHRASQWHEITAGDVQGRAEATRLARTDTKAAFAVARKIAHPWYRCQALTAIAEELASPRERVAVLMEAVKAAYEQPEPNRIACVGAWPLRVLVAVDAAAARREVERLLETISREPHGLRRLDGLRGILEAVLSSTELRGLVLPAFMQAANSSSGWRTERTVSFMAQTLGNVDLDAAKALLHGRTRNRFTSRAAAAVSGSA
jgi:hypothetical protein